MMLTARKGLPGHAIYAIVRNAKELIESCARILFQTVTGRGSP